MNGPRPQRLSFGSRGDGIREDIEATTWRSNDMAELARPLGSRPVRLHIPGWLENLVSGCQVLAGMELVAQPLQLLLEIKRLILELPDSNDLHEQLLARSLLIRVFGRLACQAGLENDVRFANVLIQL